MSEEPICVDLDGTLTSIDTLVLSLWVLALSCPWRLPGLIWTIGDRAAFKRKIAGIVTIRPELIRYRSDLLEELRRLGQMGHELVLVTGASIEVASLVSDHIGLFSEVLATQDVNLTGSSKASALCERYGEKAFVYAGNHTVDLKVWSRSSKAIVVGDSVLLEQARGVAEILFFLPKDSIVRRFGCYVSYVIRHWETRPRE